MERKITVQGNISQLVQRN